MWSVPYFASILLLGKIDNGKYKECLRIDPPTQPGKKGPNYSHYHKNGKGKHYSPIPGDPDPGF